MQDLDRLLVEIGYACEFLCTVSFVVAKEHVCDRHEVQKVLDEDVQHSRYKVIIRRYDVIFFVQNERYLCQDFDRES